MSGEGFPSPQRQEIEGQITFDDLEEEKKDPRTLAVEKINSAVEIDDLKSMGSDLDKDFGGDEELEAIFKKRGETIDLRDRHIRNVRDYKTRENLKWLLDYTKDNQDFNFS